MSASCCRTESTICCGVLRGCSSQSLRIDLVADDHVTALLHALRGRSLVVGVRLLVDGVRRSEVTAAARRALPLQTAARSGSSAGRASRLLMALMSGWVKVWLPISCPSRYTRCMMPTLFSASSPIMKKVPFTFSFFSTSRIFRRPLRVRSVVERQRQLLRVVAEVVHGVRPRIGESSLPSRSASRHRW